MMASVYGVEKLLGKIPVQLYVGFELLSFALRFLHGRGLIHDEMRDCVFDRKVDKREIIASLKFGRVCDLCRSDLNRHLDEDQWLAVEHVFRLIQEIANSEEPQEALDSHTTAIEGVLPGVFLCHSSGDKDFVRRLASDLVSVNCRVWFDEWEIRVGDNIVQRISEGISDSDFLVVVLSESSLASRWVQSEWTSMFMQVANRKGAGVLPILLEDVPVPSLLAPIKYADFRDMQGYDVALHELVMAVCPNNGTV